MTRTRNMSDLLDSSGDVKSGALDNVPASNDASALTTGTLPAARLPAEIVSSDTSPQLGGVLDTNGNNIEFPDSSGAEVNRLKFGTGDDLHIYHNGFGSQIVDEGTGPLNLRGDVVNIANAANTEYMARFTQDGSVELYHNHSKKLETTSTGIDVTGTAEMDTLSIGGVAVTSTPAELNILDGVTATTTELNYVDGVTSAIQTQIDNINTDLVNDTSPQLGGTLDTNSQAIQFGSSKWTIELSGNNLLFKYNGTAKIKFAEDGEIVTVDDVTAFGTI